MLFSIIDQALIALPLVLGAYITISLLKLPDFSIESAYLFGAVVGVLTMNFPLPMILLSSVGGGMIVGITVAVLNQCLRIPYLLAAIVTNGLFHGLTQYLLGISLVSLHVNFPGSEILFCAMLGAVILVIYYFISNSQMGFALAIYGNNSQFFQHHSISGKYVLFVGVLLGHGLAGLSGFLFAQSNGFVDLTMNYGILLLCLTSLMAGKLFIHTARPNVGVAIIGVVVYFVLQQMILRLGIDLKFFNSFQALLVLGMLIVGSKKYTLTLDHLGV